MKNHNEFLKDVEVESSLPAQTCRALGPESDEDIAMYADDSQQGNNSSDVTSVLTPADTQIKDAVYTEGVKDGK